MVNEDSLARMHAVRASIYDVCMLWLEGCGKVEEVRKVFETLFKEIVHPSTSYMKGPCYEYAACVAAAVAVIVAIL